MTSVIAMSCLLAALPAASSGTGALPPDRGPLTRLNVVLLLSDDHMLTALGCAGNPRIRTPHLDRLAASGVRFTHCFSPNPICTPSRACLLTGQDSWTNGCTFFGKPIAGSSPLWPRLLADAGYETFFTGKWHNDGRPSTRGFTAGADIFVGGMYDHRRLPVVQYGEPRKSRRPASKYSSTLFVDAAIRFLEHREGDKPFALFVSFTVPHDPWVPPPGYSGTYRPADMPVPANFRPEPPFRFDREKFPRLRDQSQLPFPRTRKDVRQALARYYAMITHMDAEIGRLLEKLKEKNLAGRTLVIFTSDHGYSMGSHGFVGKQTMNEEGIRMPLILHHPRLERAAPTSSALVNLVDILPTICEAAGIDVPEGVEGKSLLGLYAGEASRWRSRIFASFHSPTRHGMSTRCIRTTRYKLIQHLLTGEVELFDLEKDPHELKNLAGKAASSKVEERLTRELLGWRRGTPEK